MVTKYVSQWRFIVFLIFFALVMPQGLKLETQTAAPSRVKKAFTTRIRDGRFRISGVATRLRANRSRSDGVEPFVTSGENCHRRILEIHRGLLPKFLTSLPTSLVVFYVRDSSRVAYGISVSIILLRSKQLSGTQRLCAVEFFRRD